jgi:hypothetical protein
MNIKIIDKLTHYFNEYVENYKKACEKYGVWWKIFTVSMIGMALVFIIFAIFLAVYFIP